MRHISHLILRNPEAQRQNRRSENLQIVTALPWFDIFKFGKSTDIGLRLPEVISTWKVDKIQDGGMVDSRLACLEIRKGVPEGTFQVYIFKSVQNLA